MANPTIIHFAKGAADGLSFEFEDPADGLELALRILREIYDELPDDLPTEERLVLNDILIDGTYLRLNLFLGSDHDKAEVEEEFGILDSDDLLEQPLDSDPSQPSPN